MIRPVILLVLSLLTAPALGAQSTPSPAAPRTQETAIRAGVYVLEITYGGGILDGELTIGYSRDTLTAKLMVSGHESPVKAGAQRGTHLTLDPQSPAMQVRYELDFKGEEVTGTFIYGDSEGAVKGRLRRVER